MRNEVRPANNLTFQMLSLVLSRSLQSVQSDIMNHLIKLSNSDKISNSTLVTINERFISRQMFACQHMKATLCVVASGDSCNVETRDRPVWGLCVLS